MTAKKQKILVIIRQAPYSSVLPEAALDIVLTAAAFEQEVSLLFFSQGVLHLLAQESTDSSAMKNISRALPSLELYEVNNILLDREALQANALQEDELLLPAKLLNPVEISAAITAADQVFNC